MTELINDHGMLANRVQLEDLYRVPEVPRTDTWNPVHHKHLVESLDYALESWGYKIKETQLSLSHNGMRLFGAHVLQDGFDGDKTWAIGFRNSMDKSMALGICAGLHVFICTNLALTGDFVQLLRHTSKMDIERIRSAAHNAVNQISSQFQNFEAFYERLGEYRLSRSDAEALLFRAKQEKVLGPHEFWEVEKIWFENQGLAEYGPNLGGFHGAMTEMLTSKSLLGVGQRNKHLNAFLNGRMAELDDYAMITNTWEQELDI